MRGKIDSWEGDEYLKAKLFSMPDFEKISFPVLLLNEKIAKQNLEVMVGKFRNAGVEFRPHFKTHQSRQLGRWFRDAGVKSITVSSLAMARYFAGDGWDDITVAFPVNIRRMDLIRDLAQRVNLHLLVEDPESVAALGVEKELKVSVWIKIDVGTGRTGIPYHAIEQIENVISAISKFGNLQFSGFLAHPGHTYSAGNIEEINEIHLESVQRMTGLKERFGRQFPALRISLGDTPSAGVATDFTGIDEFRPGNFIFYDLMQEHLGACGIEDIAICMACPIVALHPDRKEIVIHGGAVHFGKESLSSGGRVHFGLVVANDEQNWRSREIHGFLTALSQEHGIVHMEEQFMKQYKVGDLLTILPVHSCLTADAMGRIYGLEGILYDHFRSGKGAD